MQGKENFSNIIRDYVNGHLSEDEHDTLIQYFYEQGECNSDELYQSLADQIDSLNSEELNRFHFLLKRDFATLNGRNNTIPVKIITKFSWKWLVAASVIPLCSISLFFLLSNYNPFFKSTENLHKFAQVITGPKETLLVELPDGSEVTMNSESSLKYAKDFNSNERIVYLDGEAFFNVQPDSERPFIVRSQEGIYTKVLGTSFNIRTYKDLTDVKVGVATGKVEVGSLAKDGTFGSLVPGQELIYEKLNKVFKIQEAKDIASWMDGKLIFSESTMSDVLAEIKRKFDVKIILHPSVPTDLKCTGDFSMNDTPEEIINVLCKLHNLKYELKTNTITLN